MSRVSGGTVTKAGRGKNAARRKLAGYRTWIELDRTALVHNYRVFRELIGEHPMLFAVVKSNAYGHGLFHISKELDGMGADGFCVDSILEGMALRESGIWRPILVLGATLPEMLPEASRRKLMVTISSFEGLRALLAMKRPPEFHLKIDTGMHRQGFYPREADKIMRMLSSTNSRRKLRGVYTHFAAATRKGSLETEEQYRSFLTVREKFRRAGFDDLKFHCSATGGTLMDQRYHLDMVRVGKGLYGFFPAPELERDSKLELAPVLTWRTLVTEVKILPKGARVGYDLTEEVKRKTKLAILPVGYWHGFPRSLSGKGEVLIRGKKAKVLGRVSMDILAVDATGIPVRPGDEATLLGRAGTEELRAPEVARRAGTIAYELLTRLNPLIHKILI